MMSYIPLIEIVDPRGLKIDFKNYVYYTVLVLIFYTPEYVDLEINLKNKKFFIIVICLNLIDEIL